MFFPRNWRNHNLFYILVAIEFPITVIILTFAGIASHDLFRTKLWQDGADNGFNSAPDEVVYAAANYRTFKIPMVWSSFITDYNLVLSVLSTFFMITKAAVHVLRIWYPPLSVIVHAGLFALYIASAAYQAGSDTSDPKHPQRGPPWYITKQCSVASNPDNVGYCQQAKVLFAFTIIIIVVYFVELVVSIHSCIPTEEERAEHAERREEKRTMKEYEDMVLKSPMIPMTPAAPPPEAMPGMQASPMMTPRSLAFNRLGRDSSDLPLREHFSAPNPRRSLHQESAETLTPGHQAPVQTYFPPPPKKAAKT